jgi:endonuclease YncB( thermonuclease family)
MSLDQEQTRALMDCNNDVDLFTLSGMEVVAKIVDIYDGDSFKACFYYNGCLTKFICRCYGYDCPEMHPKKDSPNRSQEKIWAHIAKRAFINVIKPDQRLVHLKIGDFDKYGRLLATIFVDDLDISVNQYMIDNGYAKAYYGQRKEKFIVFRPKKFRIQLKK